MRVSMKTMTAVAALATAGAAQAADVEVLHWWTSGGEAAALNVLKDDLGGQGIGWQDMPVAGGGGTQAMTVLRARVTAGNAPTAVQMLGFDITRLGATKARIGRPECRSRRRRTGTKLLPEALQRLRYPGRRQVGLRPRQRAFHELGLGQQSRCIDEQWASTIRRPRGMSSRQRWRPLSAAGCDTLSRMAVRPGRMPPMFDAVAMATGGPEFYQSRFYRSR